MKKSVIIISVLILLIASWFGYKEIRRASLLSSGEELLLIKDDGSSFVYSTNIIADNIDRSWDVINKVSALTPEKIAKLTEGIQEYQEQTVATIQKDFDVQIPNDQEAVGWKVVIDSLTPAQKDACEGIEALDYGQFCLVSHYIHKLINSSAGIEECNNIFLQDHQDNCKKALTNPEEYRSQDTNNNGVLDFFEQYTPPENSESFSEGPVVIN